MLSNVYSYPYDTLVDAVYYGLYLPNELEPKGYLSAAVVRKIPWTDDFKISHEAPLKVELLDSSKGKDTGGACTEAFSRLVALLKEHKLFNLHTITWPHEDFTILSVQYPVRVWRFAASLFGIICQGAHITAYVNTDAGIKIWTPRRSANVGTFPNMLDSTVAGGVSAGYTPYQTAIKEGYEEASLPADLLERDMRPVGVLTYMTQGDAGHGKDLGLAMPDAIHVYDLELAADVVPTPCDDEVKEFYLMGVAEVKAALLRREFKPNVAIVLVDFFIRHGIITDGNEPDYAEINMRIHRKLPFATSPWR